MTSHAVFLELAAAAIDFGLSPSERSRLEAHLAACPACARTAAAIRGDASALEHLPPVALPERRAAEILAAAMHPAAVRHPLRLVLVAALLTLVTLGSLVAGAELLRRSQDEDQLVVVPPIATETPASTPSASLVPSASPVATASDEPAASVAPSAPPVSGPAVIPGSLPLPSGSASVAPAAGRGVWALVNDPPDRATDAGRAVLVLLTIDGEPAPGWPQEIQGVVCGIRDGVPAAPTSQLPLVAPDGSVRLLCRAVSPDATPAVFALSFDPAGAQTPGWPVVLPSDPVDARMVGDTMVLATSSMLTDNDGALLEGEFRILRVSAAGRLEQGQAAPMARNSSYDPRLAADGVAFQRWVHDQDTDPSTEILAFGFNGALPGWPVSVPGIVSAPVLGPDGRYYAVSSARADWDALAAGQALVALEPDGTLAVGAELPTAGISEATFAGGYAPIAPVIGSDGSAWILGVNSRENVVVHALGPDGSIRDGWPWRAGAPIEEQGECEPASTGCGVWRTVPVLGPGETFLVLLAPADRTSGGQLVAVGSDGRIMNGWSVELSNRNERLDLVAAGADGMVYVTRVAPSGAGETISVLAITSDGVRAWPFTLVGE